MNIKGQGHSLTLDQGHLDSTFSNIVSLETARPIQAKFHVDPPCDTWTKTCLNGTGHMTKMAALPFSGNKRSTNLKVDMVLEYYQVRLNSGTRLTVTHFTARSNFVPYPFVWEDGKTMDFSETIVVYDIKVGRCSQLNECMKLYEYQRPFIELGPDISDSIF